MKTFQFRKSRNVTRAIPLLALAFLHIAPPAEASPISGADLSHALEMCLTHSSGQSFQVGNVWGCCLPSGGWCVVCTGSPSADKVCEFSYTTKGKPPRNAEVFPIDPSGVIGTGKSGVSRLDELYDLVE